MAEAAKAIAQEFGIPVTSQKRNAAQTQRLDSNFRSDHFTGNTNAFAVDFGVSGRRGDEFARALAQKYGIPKGNIGTYNRHIINVDGQRYSLQLLWKVQGHFDYVHLGHPARRLTFSTASEQEKLFPPVPGDTVALARTGSGSSLQEMRSGGDENQTCGNARAKP